MGNAYPMVDDDLVIRADHDHAMARTLVSLERSLNSDMACASPSAEFINHRCPKCNGSLLSDGKFVWCSCIGGFEERTCDYGIKTPAADGTSKIA